MEIIPMQPKSLRSKLIRLAYNRPDLRPQILPILKEGAPPTIAKEYQKFNKAYTDFWRAAAPFTDVMKQLRLLAPAMRVFSRDLLLNAGRPAWGVGAWPDVYYAGRKIGPIVQRNLTGAMSALDDYMRSVPIAKDSLMKRGPQSYLGVDLEKLYFLAGYPYEFQSDIVKMDRLGYVVFDLKGKIVDFGDIEGDNFNSQLARKIIPTIITLTDTPG